ncbi:MAG: oxidoreductase, partial [Pirellulaceae bacterium]
MERSKALVVHNLDDGTITRVIETRNLTEPREDWVRVRIKYSALNYKDALAATGNPGVALTFPLVPGIDAVGEV